MFVCLPSIYASNLKDSVYHYHFSHFLSHMHK
jgi:hypothetical protein